MAAVVFVIVFLTVLAGWYSTLAVRTWRNPAQAAKTFNAVRFRVSPSTAHGLVRGIALLAGGYCCLALAVVVGITFGGTSMMTAGQTARRGGPKPWWVWTDIGLLGLMMASWLTLIVVVLVNRPRIFVVPYLRDEAGSLRARKARRASRRAGLRP